MNMQVQVSHFWPLNSVAFYMSVPGTTETLGTVSLGDGDVATMEGLIPTLELPFCFPFLR